MKHMFETQMGADKDFTSEQREEIGSLKRSEGERKKLLAAFMEVCLLFYIECPKDPTPITN